MDKADLPVENAREPDEEAYEPRINYKDPVTNTKEKRNNVTFAATTTDGPQNNSAYKILISQPPGGLTHKQKLLWLQQRRTGGLWAQCDDCRCWRYLPRVLDSHELPAKWYCWMNPDTSVASCSAPEAPIRLHDEEDLIHAEYAAGSLVLARLPGFPWWPAMVDDCPDTEQYYWLDGFSDIPTHYNVVFFDAHDVTRAWISPERLMPYKNNTILRKSLKVGKYRNRLDAAVKQANDAEILTLPARLAKYSFIARYNGPISSPKKIKKKELLKYQNQLKRKFNIDFGGDLTDSEEEEDNEAEKRKTKKTEKKMTTKMDTLFQESTDVISTRQTPEDFSINTTKGSSSSQLHTDSGVIQNQLSEVTNRNTDDKELGSTMEGCSTSEQIQETQEDSQQSGFSIVCALPNLCASADDGDTQDIKKTAASDNNLSVPSTTSTSGHTNHDATINKIGC